MMETTLPGVKLVGRGKVRDIFEVGENLLIVATDRLSAFDVVLSDPIPDKGRVLTQLSKCLHFSRSLGKVISSVSSSKLRVNRHKGFRLASRTSNSAFRGPRLVLKIPSVRDLAIRYYKSWIRSKRVPALRRAPLARVLRRRRALRQTTFPKPWQRCRWT